MTHPVSPRAVTRLLRVGVSLFGDDREAWAGFIVELPSRTKEALIAHWAAAGRTPQLAPDGD